MRLWPQAHLTSLTSLAILLSSSLFLSGCALFRENTGPAPVYGPRIQVYNEDYENVWRAVQITVQNYPIRVNNYDTGIIETEVINGYKAWEPPHQELRPDGYSYKLNIKVIKGRAGSRPANQVAVLKEGSRTKDFFSEAESLPSDGLEEKSILYRIERELIINRALQRSVKNQSTPGF